MRGHIKKRGKSWCVVLYLGIDPATGKKKYKWHTAKGPGGKPATKKDAEKLLTELMQQVNSGEYIESQDLTVNEYLNKWIEEYCISRLAPRTLHSYRYEIKKNIAPQLGQIKLDKLKPLHIQNYYNWAQRSKEEDGAGLSSTTALYHHRILHRAFGQAVRWQLLSRNPCDAVEPPVKAETEARVLTPEETVKLFEESAGTILYLPIVLAATMGMRRGEVSGLRWEDVDLQNGIVFIRNQLQRIDSKLIIRPVKTKKKGSGKVALPKSVVTLLKKQKVIQNEKKLASGGFYEDQGFVCTWDDGQPIDPDYITKNFKKLLTKACLPKIKFHELRHTNVTLMLQGGVDIKIASKRVRHSSTRITQDIYSHVLPSMDEAAAAVIDDMLFPNKSK